MKPPLAFDSGVLNLDDLLGMSVPEKSVEAATAPTTSFDVVTTTFKADPIQTLSAEGLETCRLIDVGATTFTAKLLEKLQLLPQAKPSAVKSLE